MQLLFSIYIFGSRGLSPGGPLQPSTSPSSLMGLHVNFKAIKLKTEHSRALSFSWAMPLLTTESPILRQGKVSMALVAFLQVALLFDFGFSPGQPRLGSPDTMTDTLDSTSSYIAGVLCFPLSKCTNTYGFPLL